MAGYNTDDKNRYVYGSEAYDFDMHIVNPAEQDEVVIRKVKRKKLKKSAIANRLMCVYITGVMVAVSLLSVIGYSFIYNAKSEVDKLSNELQNLKNDTAILENQIIEGANLDNIYDIATNKLGMVRPTADKINYINVDNQSYTRQFGKLTDNQIKVNDKSFLASILKKVEMKK